MTREYNNYKEMMRKARGQIKRGSKKPGVNMGMLENYQRMVDGMGDLIKENKKFQEQKERLQLKLADEKKQKTDLKYQKAELLKLSAMIIQRLGARADIINKQLVGLLPAEDIKKVERRVAKDEKEMQKETKKLPKGK